MKKLVFMMIALCLILSACTKEEKTGVWVCVRETEYRDAIWGEPNPVVLGERSYDKQGRLVQAYENRFSDMGWEAYHDRFAYDAHGKLVFHNRYKEEADEKRYYSYYSDQLFYYDKDGNLIRRYVYDLDEKLIGKMSNEYDENGRIISQKIFSISWGMDAPYRETIYTYSEDGSMCDELCYNFGKLTDHIQYFYDDTGAVSMKKEKYDEVQHGTSPDWHVTEYRSDGKIERSYDLYDNGHTSNESRNVYDENGKLLESYSISSRGVITDRRINEYDKDGNLVEIHIYDLSGEVRSIPVRQENYTKYDEHGNLIECGNYGYGRHRVYEWVFLPGVTEVEDRDMALPEYPPQWIR